MTETMVDVSPSEPEEPSAGASAEEIEAARELVRAARAKGVALTGPEGLLKALTKTVIETALEQEMSDHLGYASTWSPEPWTPRAPGRHDGQCGGSPP